jgi:hypothetical protein
MKYLIKKDSIGSWFEIKTDFVITEILHGLISRAKGIEIDEGAPKKRYTLCFWVSKMFDVEAVKKDISKIIDAYIQSNKNADKAEDKSLMEFAEQAEQYNFIRNYKK